MREEANIPRRPLCAALTRLTALIMTTLERQTHTKDLACKGVNNNYHAVVSLVYLVAKSRCTPATKAGRVARVDDNIIINCYC